MRGQTDWSLYGGRIRKYPFPHHLIEAQQKVFRGKKKGGMKVKKNHVHNIKFFLILIKAGVKGHLGGSVN